MNLNALPTDVPALASVLDDRNVSRPATWVLLWSQSQNALHIESLDDMQQTNADAFRENRRMDYVPLFVGSRAIVDTVANAVRPVCHSRKRGRALAAYGNTQTLKQSV